MPTQQMLKITQDVRNLVASKIAQKPVVMIRPNIVKQIRDGICPECGVYHDELRPDDSVKEYGISGMCQKCQDEYFGA